MTNNRNIFIALLATATLAGCVTTPDDNPGLNEARSDYSEAKSNPQIIKLAPNEFKIAGDALEKANNASNNFLDEEKITHLAYLAIQRVAIATETAKQKASEIAIAEASLQRSKIRLEARTEEADQAQENVEASMLESTLSQEQAREAEIRASQLEAQLKELNAKKTERGMVITLGDILFDSNKALLKAGGTNSLQKLAKLLRQYPQTNAQIDGYTDSTGSAEHNLGLSDRRAKAVRTSLVGMGIEKNRLTTQGHGIESPIATNTTPVGRQLNRRVEIILSDESGKISFLP